MKRTKCTTTTKRQREPYTGLVSVILLADVPGYRMKSYGPTSLLEVKKNRLIDHQIKAVCNAFPNSEIVICTGFESEKINRYVRYTYDNSSIRMVENQLFNNTNSCESLRLALNNIHNDDLFIIDGSLLFTNKALQSCKMQESLVYIDDKCGEQFEVGVNINENATVEYFSFGASKGWSEIMFLKGEKTIEQLRRILYMETFKTKFIFEAINELIRVDHTIKAVKNRAKIHKINNIKTYNELKGKK